MLTGSSPGIPSFHYDSHMRLPVLCDFWRRWHQTQVVRRTCRLLHLHFVPLLGRFEEERRNLRIELGTYISTNFLHGSPPFHTSAIGTRSRHRTEGVGYR